MNCIKWTIVAGNETVPASGVKVIAFTKTKEGKTRKIMAMHLAAVSRECSCEYDCDCVYDELLDNSYYPEGWYEVVENWDDWHFIPVSFGEVTHWQPLPDNPE